MDSKVEITASHPRKKDKSETDPCGWVARETYNGELLIENDNSLS